MRPSPTRPLPPGIAAGTCLLLLAAGPRPLPAEPPTTAPDAAASLDVRHIATLKAMCRQLHQRCWGRPVVETFADPPAKNPWQAEGGKLQFKDGGLVFALAGDKRRLVAVKRSLPPQLRGANGIRVDVWVDGDPVDWQLGGQPARKRTLFNLGLFLDTRALGQNQWEYTYFFAVGTDGSMQYFRSIYQNTVQTTKAPPLPPGRVVHVRMELAGAEVSCRRDGAAPLKARLVGAPRLTLNAKTAVGLVGYFKRLRVTRVTYRPLSTAVSMAELAGQWKKTPFADHEAFTRHLLDRVIPELDAPRFETRQRAEQLLTSLWPLSRAAIEAASRQARIRPEARLRLQNLLDYAPPIKVVTTQPDDDDQFEPPPPAKPKPVPTTQPANALPSGSG